MDEDIQIWKMQDLDNDPEEEVIPFAFVVSILMRQHFNESAVSRHLSTNSRAGYTWSAFSFRNLCIC